MGFQYNWQLADWPSFSYDYSKLDNYEMKYLYQSGVLQGLDLALGDPDKMLLKINFLSEEAFKTSEIEGELLNRDSIQSSIKRLFGLNTPAFRNHPREYGVAEMQVDLYKDFAAPLTHEKLHEWHKMLMNGRRDLQTIGKYREHVEPMQTVSGRIDRPKIYFEAPPSPLVQPEMDKFIEWFNESFTTLPTLIRAGITHLYFESIHPFKDGNGRIGRALVEKSLAQNLGKPTFILLSKAIQRKRKLYYKALNKASLSNEITHWLKYFSELILEALELTHKEWELVLKKVQVFNTYRGKINSRQEKVLLKLFQAGVDGFQGGLSAENYKAITKTSSATATRDLNALVDLGILVKTGEYKSTRYWIA